MPSTDLELSTSAQLPGSVNDQGEAPTDVESSATSVLLNTVQPNTDSGNQSITFKPSQCTEETVNQSNASTPKAAEEKSAAVMPQPLVSKETFDHISRIMDVFNLVYEAVSIVLTFTSAIIYALPSMRCATACYLVALNTCDTVSGLIVVIRAAWHSASTTAKTTAEYHYLTIIGSMYVSVSCRRMVYWMSAMVSMERFFVIAFPMKARYIQLVRYPKLCILVMLVIVLSMNVYLPLKYQVKPSSRGAGYSMAHTDAFKSNQETFDGSANAAKYLLAYMPLALCLVLSVALMVALRRHAVSRQSLQEVKDVGKGNDNSGSAERQLAMTIWLSTLLFALLSLPSNTTQMVASYHSTFRFMGLEHRLYTLVGRFCHVALVTTRFTNFFAYLGLSTAFRHTLIRLLCPEKVVHRLLGGQRKSDGQTCSRISGTSQTEVSAISNL